MTLFFGQASIYGSCYTLGWVLFCVDYVYCVRTQPFCPVLFNTKRTNEYLPTSLIWSGRATRLGKRFDASLF